MCSGVWAQPIGKELPLNLNRKLTMAITQGLAINNYVWGTTQNRCQGARRPWPKPGQTNQHPTIRTKAERGQNETPFLFRNRIQYSSRTESAGFLDWNVFTIRYWGNIKPDSEVLILRELTLSRAKCLSRNTSEHR